jgi:hypothetical protein
MSNDTTAFLAGCAITGVAAVLLLRGGVLAGAPRGAPLSQVPAVAPVSVMPVPSPATPPAGLTQSEERAWQLQRELEQQKVVTNDLKNQFTTQQTVMQDLRSQVDRQKIETEQLLSRLDQQQRLIDTMSVQQQLSDADQSRFSEQLRDANRSKPTVIPPQSPSTQTTLLWGIGVIFLIMAFGGGILLLIVIFLLAQASSQRRYPRATHVIHPMLPPPYPISEQALLPAHATRSRRPPRQIDYYED